MSQSSARPQLVDDALPGFSSLLHGRVPAPVDAVYEAAGTSVDSLSTIQCTWRPGKQATVRYRVDGSGGDLAGSRDVVATIGSIPEEAAIVEGPDARIGVWVVPNDPLLPGLASALHLPTVSELVADLGSAEQATRARLRAYRPGRRAVVEVEAGRSSIFLKVVPPSGVEALHERHRSLSGLLPIPDSLGLSRDLGIVVMPAVSGVDLRSLLRAGQRAPHPSSLARMVEDLPEPRSDWVARSPLETLPGVMQLLRRLVPGESARLGWIEEEIGVERDDERVPVHGDFHEAQILVRAERPVGLIDVDTFGWGRGGDDAATMLGHLHLLAPSCREPERVIELARELNRHWDAGLDPVDLRLRTAAVVVGLATGPFRVQRPEWPEETRQRIAIAQKWVESAHRVDERSLIASSVGSHATSG